MKKYPETVEDLENLLSEPSLPVQKVLRRLEGDFLVLGAAGKMGPSICAMLQRGCQNEGLSKRVIGVSRFSDPKVKGCLESCGVETIECDLLDEAGLLDLPESENIIYLAGMKFGTTGKESLTWAINTYLPALVSKRYSKSRIAALSTGNVYPMVSTAGRGCSEFHPTGPLGEYAQSCLGRERMFQYFSLENGTPVSIIRLNYATELRYGVLVDIAQKVISGIPVDLKMGYVNLIWQADANRAIIESLELASSPPLTINLTGREKVSVRETAERFGEIFGKRPVFENMEEDTALLSDSSFLCERLGPPPTSVSEMVNMAAAWIEKGGQTFNKPTHFDTKDGRF